MLIGTGRCIPGGVGEGEEEEERKEIWWREQKIPNEAGLAERPAWLIELINVRYGALPALTRHGIQLSKPISVSSLGGPPPRA